MNSLYLKDHERCVSAARDNRLMPDGNRCLPVDDRTEILELEVSLEVSGSVLGESWKFVLRVWAKCSKGWMTDWGWFLFQRDGYWESNCE